ncbi:MAG: 3-methyl-2-oxobutanoate dehydrogenase subunit VorB, partial [Oscillospiraceae bacterium]
KQMPKLGGTYLQAESEVAAINMVYGAASAGVRAMTSSSSPGISLKCEGISYTAACDLPCLIVNVQRGGPGLGGIQPAQSDYWQATRAPGHGDLHLLVFVPSTVQEVVDMVRDAFEMSEKYRVPAMLMADGMIGQMMEPVILPEPVDGKSDKPWATCGHQNKRPHNITNSLFLLPEQLESTVVERFSRYKQIMDKEQRAEEYRCDDAEYFLVAFGTTARIAKTAVDALRERGVKAGLIRPMMIWPFPQKTIDRRAAQAKGFLSVEMNMGQMIDDVRLVVNGRCPIELVGRTGGVVPTPAEIIDKALAMAEGGK